MSDEQKSSWWRNPFGSGMFQDGRTTLSDKKHRPKRTTDVDAPPDATKKDSDEIENPFGSMKDIISALGGGAENPFSSGKSDARQAADDSNWWKNPFGSGKSDARQAADDSNWWKNPFGSGKSATSEELDFMDDAQASGLESELAEAKRDIARLERKLERRQKRRERRGNRNPIGSGPDTPMGR
jgi:hypothetical protein